MTTPGPLPRHTKIVATLGPASNTFGKIKALAGAGANVFRMKFSHGTHEDHAAVHAAVGAVEGEPDARPLFLRSFRGPSVGMVKCNQNIWIEEPLGGTALYAGGSVLKKGGNNH
ncbi:pyruvate kinase [Parasedimentitalea denitrificans]|uniref:pyruvate kinase n=1 Tax=Parasedimentitalea denitrificans TaxID=2211118 RepID=UPI0019811463|nr:pyruvate kinase [Sedimentitalea sp. CY04]